MSRAPHLTRALVLETPVIIKDGAGGFTKGWQVLGTLWGEIRAGAGRERFATLGPAGEVTLRILVRGAPHGSDQRPRPEQRFREGARIFRILAVAEADVQGRYLVCTAQEELPA
ncbi:MAG: head-tail adaptor protein [Rhodobacteraceae bacterium]|nr:MAG: head-tail adaptor protein [Paracoccaceae bacterium]